MAGARARRRVAAAVHHYPVHFPVRTRWHIVTTRRRYGYFRGGAVGWRSYWDDLIYLVRG